MFSNHRRLAALIVAAMTILTVVDPTTVHAYVGPTAGVSFLGAAVGVVAAFFSAIGIILFWPIRLLVRKIRGMRSEGPATQLVASQAERKSNHGTV